MGSTFRIDFEERLCDADDDDRIVAPNMHPTRPWRSQIRNRLWNLLGW
jgi:hypothetical protein